MLGSKLNNSVRRSISTRSLFFIELTRLGKYCSPVPQRHYTLPLLYKEKEKEKVNKDKERERERERDRERERERERDRYREQKTDRERDR